MAGSGSDIWNPNPSWNPSHEGRHGEQALWQPKYETARNAFISEWQPKYSFGMGAPTDSAIQQAIEAYYSLPQNAYSTPGFAGPGGIKIPFTTEPEAARSSGLFQEPEFLGGGKEADWSDKWGPAIGMATMFAPVAPFAYGAIGALGAGAGAGAGGAGVMGAGMYPEVMGLTAAEIASGAGTVGAGAGAGFGAGELGAMGAGMYPETMGLTSAEIAAGTGSGVAAGWTPELGGVMGAGMYPEAMGSSMAPVAGAAGGGAAGGGASSWSTYLLDSLTKNWPQLAMLGAGSALDYFNSQKQAEQAQETSKDYLAALSGIQGQQQQAMDNAFVQSLQQNQSNYANYMNAYEAVKEAAKPDIPGYTKAMQGIVSEQSEAAKRKAAAKAAELGRGGGSYGKDVDTIRRQGLETTARGLLPLYQGYNIPLPQVQQTVTPGVANAPIPQYAAYQGANADGTTEWLSKLLGLGGQYLGQVQTQKLLEQILRGGNIK